MLTLRDGHCRQIFYERRANGSFQGKCQASAKAEKLWKADVAIAFNLIRHWH